jgi:hypothetical protein
MSIRSSLLDEYNRTLRRKLGQESLAEKIEAIRNGSGFRIQQRFSQPARMAESADFAVSNPSRT